MKLDKHRNTIVFFNANSIKPKASSCFGHIGLHLFEAHEKKIPAGEAAVGGICILKKYPNAERQLVFTKSNGQVKEDLNLVQN